MANPMSDGPPPRGAWDPPQPAPVQRAAYPASPRPGEKAATTSLVCGIIGLAVVFFVCPLAIAAVVLGIVAVRQAAKARREAGAAGVAAPSNAAVGRGLGIASIVLGALATIVVVVGATVLIVAAASGWWDVGERPRVVACEGSETSTRVAVELVAGADETITYDYTVEVRDASNVIAQVSRTVAVQGLERETVLVPLPNGTSCVVSSWWAG